METIYLAGAENVRNASHAMQNAADGMQTAASTILYALEAHQRFLDDWLLRFQDAIETMKADRK